MGFTLLDKGGVMQFGPGQAVMSGASGNADPAPKTDLNSMAASPPAPPSLAMSPATAAAR
jgi:hypothetical protein